MEYIDDIYLLTVHRLSVTVGKESFTLLDFDNSNKELLNHNE